jgi:imidazolonepropionase-like amidohydrolase
MTFSGNVHAGWIIDGTGCPAVRNTVLQIREGMLRAMRPAHDVPASEESVMDFSDATVLPGLVDSHVHLGLPEAELPGLAPGETMMARAGRYPVCGVFAVRDGGERSGRLLGLRDRTPEKRWSHEPVICMAGPALHRVGRYGRFVGTSLGHADGLPEAVAGLAPRVDHVKIMNSGLNSLTRFGRQTPGQFSMEELTEAVRVAGRFSRKVMVHANGEGPVRDAVEAGCASIEHGYFMGEENLLRMRDRQTVWVPTAIPMAAHGWMLDPGSRESDVARRTLEDQLEQMALASRLGVPVATGTDAGCPGVEHGAGLIEELNLFRMAGFSTEEMIRCATEIGARLLDLRGGGRLAPGLSAAFIIVPGPPELLPGSLHRIRHRCVGGRFD